MEKQRERERGRDRTMHCKRDGEKAIHFTEPSTSQSTERLQKVQNMIKQLAELTLSQISRDMRQ